ncbi:hypothetical protein HK101_011202 [Irineochytrium annulatum]|nr:hypothetical protein HK101_011202 [Irineochytrium annulatum]
MSAVVATSALAAATVSPIATSHAVTATTTAAVVQPQTWSSVLATSTTTLPPPASASVLSSTESLFTTTSVTTTPRRVATPLPKTIAGGYPYPDPYYNTTATGPVTILYLSSQTSANLDALHNGFVANPPIRIDHRVFSPDEGYDVYVRQVLDACHEGISGMFDVVMVDAAYTGVLGDCLLDLQGWDKTIGTGFQQDVLNNSVVNGRLVSLPTASDYGVLYYNQDMLDRSNQAYPPTCYDDIEASAISALQSERTVENFDVSGVAGQYYGESLTATAAEWLYGANRSAFLTPDGSNVTVATNDVAEVLSRIAAWTNAFIIDPNDVGAPADGSTPEAASLEKFANGKAVYLRHWSSAYHTLAKMNLPFEWGVGPVVGTDANMTVGAAGGWSAGVYKYSQNPGAAVKVAKWLASPQYQKTVITQLHDHIVPTRPSLFTDTDICSELSHQLCGVIAKTTPAIRPAAITAGLYLNVSAAISQSMIDMLSGTYSIVNGLGNLDTQLRHILNIRAVDDVTSGISVDDTQVIVGKKNPGNLQLQVMGLFFVIGVTAVVFVLIRKRYLAAQQGRDVNNSPNEFQHLEENGADPEKGEMAEVEIDNDDMGETVGKKFGLASHGAPKGKFSIGTDSEMSGIDKTEKADFI